MTVRHFTRASQERVLLDAGAALDAVSGGLITIAWIWKPATVHAGGIIFASNNAGHTSKSWSVNPYSDGNTWFGTDAAADMTGSYTAAGDWLLNACANNEAGTDRRAHRYNFTSETWSHTDPGGQVASADGVLDHIVVGHFASAAAEYLDGDLAVLGVWDSFLSDNDMETLASGLAAWDALNPVALWVFDQETLDTPVADLIGGSHQNQLTGTTITLGADPAGFNFNAGRPRLVGVYPVDSGASNTDDLVTSTFDAAPDEVLVVKALSNAGDGGAFPTPSGGDLTYTQLQHDETSLHCRVGLWVATVPPEGVQDMAVTLGSPGATSNRHAMVVERWTSARVGSSPVSELALFAIAGDPQTTIDTVGTDSVVSWMCADFAVQDIALRAYDTTSAAPMETGVLDGAGFCNAYWAYQDAPAAGTQTFGLTAPDNQEWTLIGVELLAPPAGPAGGNRSRILTRGMPLRSGGA